LFLLANVPSILVALLFVNLINPAYRKHSSRRTYQPPLQFSLAKSTIAMSRRLCFL
jgi:hypothetical protein